MSQRIMWALGALLVLASAPAFAQDMTVWYSPTCGCCHLWAKHIEAAGFSVKLNETDNLDPVKKAYGVRPALASCHTARIGGYTIEGHVPAQDIRRLLAEKPDAVGLTAPGMPASAPGMDIGAEPYDVLLIRRDGTTEIFARH